jgi:signal transduction histidine kinase
MKKGQVMSLTMDELTRRYGAGLRRYLAQANETALQRAYELGRETIAGGLGVMDLAAAHEAVLTALLAESKTSTERDRAWRLGAAFFAESLWPFEMMQRGFCEANRMLRDLNDVLAGRARQLAVANQDLSREIAERRRVEAALHTSEENLRQLSNQILFAQEEERKRISRELHDEVGQSLTGISLTLMMLRRNASNRATAARIADVQAQLQQTMETIHNFTRELRPAMLDHLGLIPALRSYVRNFCRRTGLQVQLRAAPAVEELGMEEKIVLFRVTQEGLTNVAKHARARHAAVVIRRNNGHISMEVQDDGKAFPVERTSNGRSKKSLGILGMQERVRLVNGDFVLKSRPGKGTTVRVQIPSKLSGEKGNLR